MNPTVFCNGSVFAIANPFPSSPIPSPMMCVLSMGFTQAEQKYQEDLHVAACTMGDHAIFTFFFCLKMGPTYGELLKVMEKFKRENRWVSFQTHDILGGVSRWAKPQLRFQASQMGWNWAHFLRMAFKRLKTNMHICHVYLPSQVMKNYINDDQW